MKKFQKLLPIVFCLTVLFLNVCAAQSHRDTLLQPEKVMDAIGVKPGMVIGEGGAGEGYFTFKLSRRVGDTGRVYANDIVEESARGHRETLRERRHHQYHHYSGRSG